MICLRAGLITPPAPSVPVALGNRCGGTLDLGDVVDAWICPQTCVDFAVDGTPQKVAFTLSHSDGFMS